MKFYGVNKRNLTTFWTIFGKNPLWEFNANLCTCLNYLMMISKDTTLIGFTFLDQLRLFVTIWSIYRHNVFPRSLFAHLTFNFIFWNNKICIWMYYSKRIFIRQFFDYYLDTLGHFFKAILTVRFSIEVPTILIRSCFFLLTDNFLFTAI